MPKIDVGVASTTVTKARSMSLTDADAGRSTSALKSFYGQIEETDADGNVTLRDRTDAEAWDRFFEGVRRSLVDIVAKAEREQAATAAEDGVTEISVS